MDLVIGLAYLAGMIAIAVMRGRRVVRHVRAVPPRPQAEPDVRVLRRRFVRVVFGLALVAGFCHFVGGACARPSYAFDLFGAWKHAGLAAIAAGLVAPMVVRRISGDAWATSSIVLPVVGIALLLPLTLHRAAFAIVGQTMDEWCVFRLVGAGIAHLVFAILFAARTVSLARSGQTALSIGELFMLVTLAGALPFFVLGMGIVALTGVFILPVISLVEWLALREHAATAAGLPRAIVAPCRA